MMVMTSVVLKGIPCDLSTYITLDHGSPNSLNNKAGTPCERHCSHRVSTNHLGY